MIKIEKIFNELNLIVDKHRAIVNHGLKRHLVYEFYKENKWYIIKIYYKSNRVENEVAGYEVAKKLEIPCPNVIQYGKLNSGFDYIILSKCNGEIMSKQEISAMDRCLIYEELGEYLGKIHSLNSNIMSDFKLEFMNNIKKHMDAIRMLNLTSKDSRVIEKSYDYILRHIDKIDFDDVSIGYCHNDFHEGNIIVNKNEVLGIIDFEIFGKGNTELDIMSLYWKVFYKNSDIEQSFIKGYSRYKNLSERFSERLPLYCIGEAISNCKWAYGQGIECFYENLEFLKVYLKNRR